MLLLKQLKKIKNSILFLYQPFMLMLSDLQLCCEVKLCGFKSEYDTI